MIEPIDFTRMFDISKESGSFFGNPAIGMGSISIPAPTNERRLKEGEVLLATINMPVVQIAAERVLGPWDYAPQSPNEKSNDIEGSTVFNINKAFMNQLEELEEDLNKYNQNGKVVENGKTDDMARISFTSFLNRKNTDVKVEAAKPNVKQGKQQSPVKQEKSPQSPIKQGKQPSPVKQKKQQSPIKQEKSLQSPIKQGKQPIRVEEPSDTASNEEKSSSQVGIEENDRKSQSLDNQKKLDVNDVKHEDQNDQSKSENNVSESINGSLSRRDSVNNEWKSNNGSPSKKRGRDDRDDRQVVKKERRYDDKYDRKDSNRDRDYKKDERGRDDYQKPYDRDYRKDDSYRKRDDRYDDRSRDDRYDDRPRGRVDERPRSGSDRGDRGRSRPRDRDDRRRESSPRRERSASRERKAKDYRDSSRDQNTRRRDESDRYRDRSPVRQDGQRNRSRSSRRTSIKDSPGAEKESPVVKNESPAIVELQITAKEEGTTAKVLEVPDLKSPSIISPATTVPITTPTVKYLKAKHSTPMTEAAKRYKAMGDRAMAKKDKKKQYIFYAASIMAYFSLPAVPTSGHGLQYDPKYHTKFDSLKEFKNNVKDGLRRYENRELLAVIEQVEANLLLKMWSENQKEIKYYAKTLRGLGIVLNDDEATLEEKNAVRQDLKEKSEKLYTLIGENQARFETICRLNNDAHRHNPQQRPFFEGYMLDTSSESGLEKARNALVGQCKALGVDIVFKN